MKENCLVDTNSDKFQFHINQALLILKLNDSELKREALKSMLYKKFAETDLSEDDSDAPLTLALDAMRYMTDKSLKRLTSYRLLVNVLPSLLYNDDFDSISSLKEFLDQNGLLSHYDVITLQRCGLIYETNMSVYSLDAIADIIHSDVNLTEHTQTSGDNIILSTEFTSSGIILTDITLEYFFNLRGRFDHWLPMRNKSLHVNDLIVDEDAHVNQNLIVSGDTSSGGNV